MTKRKNDWKLTKFELTLNSVLTLDLLLCFATIGHKYHDVFTFILFIFFGKFAWPMNLPAQITIYSRKFLNFAWHSILLTIIVRYKNEFFLKNLDWNIPILVFIYFNIMRTLGHLIIGADPIWPTRYSHIGTRSEAKGRGIRASDFNWLLTYLLIGGILGVLYFNRGRIFYST